MLRKKSFILKTALIIILLALGSAAFYVYFALPIGTGYTAKYLCSSIFITGRGEEEAIKEDILPGNILFRLISSEVDYDEKSVTSKGLWLFHEKTAVYREGLGSTLVIGDDLERDVRGLSPRFNNSPGELWPQGELVNTEELPEAVNRVKLGEAINFAFTEPDSGGLQTRAVVVVYEGSIIAERYAPGFDHLTPMIGWSMAKTIGALITGMMVQDGLLTLNETAPVAIWQDSADPRLDITLNHLLQMTSGLEFKEVYAPFADATNMLYASRSMADYAADKPLAHSPGEHFNYSSGTANIIMKILMDTAGGEMQDIHNYIMDRLYRPLGM